jgi:ATPase subunit of ABC transporter with duplicated ATPase domains
MADSLLRDREVLAAVSRILQRSEREQNTEQLIRTYVDTGVLLQLQNDNNQILYGRRGTGKTHVLRVLGEEGRQDIDKVVLYLDLRVLGSTNQLQETGRTIPQKCISLFKDFLGELHNALLDAATDPKMTKAAPDALVRLSELAEAITRVAQFVAKRDVKRERMTEAEDALKIGASLSKSPGVSVDASSGKKATETVAESYEQHFQENLLFTEFFG